MAIQPSTARVRGGDSQVFTCDVANCTWVNPKIGTITVDKQTCVYTAPSSFKIWSSKHVELAAADAGGTSAGITVITLAPDSAWIVTLGMVYVSLFLALVIAVINIWPPAPATPWIQLTPSTVTVVPNFQQQFEARVWEAHDQGVLWSATAGIISPSGLFTAPAEASTENASDTVVITATSAADHSLLQSALVILNPRGLAVRPALASLGPSGTAYFDVTEEVALPSSASPTKAPHDATIQGTSLPAAPTNIEWLASDPSVRLTKIGNKLTVGAPEKINILTQVVLTAVDKADRKRQATAIVDLSPQGTPVGGEVTEYELRRDKRLLIMVSLMGALGALLGASRSLANFVGNDTFFPRWSLFYLFRPTFGAGLALLVFFGYRIGAVTGVRGATPADPFAATFVAGMVGLFADTVLQKLKDMVMALLPSQDERKDKITPNTAAPVIQSAQGSVLGKTMSVKGQNFVSGASASLNGHARQTAFVSFSELQVTLDPADVAGNVKVVVINPDKQSSLEFAGNINP